MSKETTVHLRVEAGPDRGRVLSIPAGGARLGRSAGNDIRLNDPSISRFQCRFYFKNRRDLAVADLASTNETLVNDKAFQDTRLFVGDHVTVGETTLEVVCDTFEAADAAPTEAPPPATEPPAAGDKSPPQAEIDLGLQPVPEPAPPRATARIGMRKLGVLAAGLAIVVAALAIWQWLDQPGERDGDPRATGDRMLAIDYEKVQASPDNIFRYRLLLTDERIGVQVLNLEDERRIDREESVPPDLVNELARQIEQSGFFNLDESYTGVVPEAWDQLDLEVVLDRRTHRVRVVNRIEPAPFREARQVIEEFARNHIGLHALPLEPEQLREMARDAWLLGQRLLDERQVRRENLALAIRAFAEVETLTETLDPKPDFYADAVAAREDARRLLDEEYDRELFRAERAIRAGDWSTANHHLRAVLDLLHSRSDERYEAVNRRLLHVQRQLERQRR